MQHLTCLSFLAPLAPVSEPSRFPLASQLNEKWAQLREKAEKKKEELESAHSYQTFHIEIRETVSWIEEKTKLLHQTEGLGSDLVRNAS